MQFVIAVYKTGLINTIPKKFLLPSIWSLVFLLSKREKRETLWTESAKSFVSHFAIFFFHKNTLGESGAFLFAARSSCFSIVKAIATTLGHTQKSRKLLNYH